MPLIQSTLHAAYLWLAAIHPLLPWALLVWVPCFVVPWVLRSFAPHLWELIPRAVDRLVLFVHLPLDGFGAAALAKIAQGLPSAVMGAVAAALALGTSPGEAAKGALAGAFAPLLHELLKAMPWVPYKGGAFPAAGTATPGGGPKSPLGGSGTAAILLFVGAGALGTLETTSGCARQRPAVCAPATDSAKIQAACDLQQAQVIQTGACNDAPDVQHCDALARLRADCAAKQAEWARSCH